MPQKPHNGKAFHFCQQICLLLATCSSVDQCCQSCNLDTSYLAYDSSIVRKRRPARRTEVADATPPPKQRPIAFEIARGRTAKHKKHAFTCDSASTDAVHELWHKRLMHYGNGQCNPCRPEHSSPRSLCIGVLPTLIWNTE